MTRVEAILEQAKDLNPKELHLLMKDLLEKANFNKKAKADLEASIKDLKEGKVDSFENLKISLGDV